jgi:hypothetical protein
LSDVTVLVPSSNTQRVQEVHGLLLHALCGLIEDDIARDGADWNVSQQGEVRLPSTP